MNVIIQSYRGVYSVCCPLPSCPVRAVVNKLTPMAAMGWHIELLGLRWVGSPRPQRYDNKLSTLKFSKLVSIYFLKDKKPLSCLGTFSDQKCLHPPVILFLWGLEKGELFHFITRVGRKGIVQWWEDSPPTNVAQVSNAGIDVICASSLLLVFSLAPRGFSPCTPIFPSA